MKRAIALLAVLAVALTGCSSVHDKLAHERAIVGRACAPGEGMADATGHSEFYDQNC